MGEKLTFKKILQEAKSYFFIFLGLAMFTFGWSAFLTPYEVSGGGVAGAADDMFMSVIIGSAIAAYGIGVAINWGGNTGGVDIIALMIGKYRNISYGRVSLFSNVLIVGASYFVLHDVQKLVYSFVVLLVSIIVSDLVIDGYRQTYQFMVFSKKNDEIAKKINTNLHRGASFLKGYGSYNHQESDVLLIVAHKTDKRAITRIIKEIDPDAFITISKTASVFGKNFDNIKI